MVIGTGLTALPVMAQSGAAELTVDDAPADKKLCEIVPVNDKEALGAFPP